MTTNAQVAKETRIKIAVIDTGLDVTPKIAPYLCNSGHKSFHGAFSFGSYDVFKDSVPQKHGTNVAGLIAQNLDNKKECLLILQFDLKNGQEIAAINYANSVDAKYINLSVGGTGFDELEFEALKTALGNGVKISVAAGNQKANLDKDCNEYPACYANLLNYRNFHVVGANSRTYTNTGHVVQYSEDSDHVGEPALSGTSQATAIHTGKWASGKF